MTLGAAPVHAVPADRRYRLLPFFAQEYLRIMRDRLALLIWIVLAYTIIALPFLMAKPPPELTHFIAAWLGPDAAEAKLLLFMWVDAAMNKLAVILGPALAGGIIVDERSRGTLDLFAAKPIRAEDYFTVKLGAAVAALASFYVAACLGAIATFPWRVANFDISDFIALSAVHLFAAIFSATFAATVATFFARKLNGLLVSISVLGLLVGLAFLGFYYPAYRTVSYLNPFFDGIVLIGSINRFGAFDMLFPIAVLVLFNVAFWLIGRHRAVRLLTEGRA
jgi:ABC-2 type transport system permease protein